MQSRRQRDREEVHEESEVLSDARESRSSSPSLIEQAAMELRIASNSYQRLLDTFLRFNPGLNHQITDKKLRHWRENVKEMGARVKSSLEKLEKASSF